jgi:hypothetical protein
MNNITKRNLALVAVFMAATLVVGTFATTTLTQTALAYSQKKKGNDNSRNGNTVTIEDCKNKGSASGFDTAVDQECENLICTHPGGNATCVQEGIATTTTTTNATTPPTKLTCQECLTKFLNAEQIFVLTRETNDLAFFCQRLSFLTTEDLHDELVGIGGVSESVAAQLIQCLIDAGVQFRTAT